MDDQLLHEIRSAKDAVADAEGDLVRILSEIDVAPRAEKTAISEALRNAILKLRSARTHLVLLETSAGAPSSDQ
jgi:hypothetical protein